MNFVVPEPKINYLLTNPKKCGFFLRFGYSVQDWTILRDDILVLARNFPMKFVRETSYGKKYEIIGDIHLTPNGRPIEITTGWMVYNEDKTMVSFVTAYPS